MITWVIDSCLFTISVPPELTPTKEIQMPFPPPVQAAPEPPKFYLCDGIMVSQFAKRHLEKIALEPPKVRRRRRWSKKPEDWDEMREEEHKIERKMQEIMEVRKATVDTETAAATPALSRLLSGGSDKDDDKGG